MVCWFVYGVVVCLWCGGLFMVWWFVYGVVVCLWCVGLFMVWWFFYGVVVCLWCGGLGGGGAVVGTMPMWSRCSGLVMVGYGGLIVA